MVEFMNFLITADLTGSNATEINNLLTKIIDLVTGTLMPIIYIALGLFLIVKGAILGMQIVKAADEPQVRQEKIGSLKWLVIGIAIAYGVAAVAHIVMNAFKGTASDLGNTNS